VAEGAAAAVAALALLFCSESPVEPRPLPTAQVCAAEPLAPVTPPSTPPGPDPDTLRVELVAGGLTSPIYAIAPPGDPRVFIVEQPGRIRIAQGGQLLATPFLDITDSVLGGGERGLLSVAFHPRYPKNGCFFVNYTDLNGDTRVKRFQVSADPNVADPNSGAQLLFIDQPFANHNGGHMLFGPDGMLYIAMGDGGSGGDPQGNGQKLTTLLGKLLRIDVDRGDPYAIPAGNPFAGPSPNRKEIWAWGLRNPWRFAFDSTGGQLWIADVGQSAWEEVNAVPIAAPSINYGWNLTEGGHCYNATTCNMTALTLPILEYSHTDGCSITGGFVYRGAAIAGLGGHYFYADYCQGWVRSFRPGEPPKQWSLGSLGNISSFGLDGAGEILVVSHGGSVYRVIP
jgi:glucose/arabinose dehydrogenase